MRLLLDVINLQPLAGMGRIQEDGTGITLPWAISCDAGHGVGEVAHRGTNRQRGPTVGAIVAKSENGSVLCFVAIEFGVEFVQTKRTAERVDLCFFAGKEEPFGKRGIVLDFKQSDVVLEFFRRIDVGLQADRNESHFCTEFVLQVVP